MAEDTVEQVQDTDVDSTDEVQDEQSDEVLAEDNKSSDDELDKRIQRANKEAAKFRVEKNQLAEELDDLKKNLGKALGFVDEQDEEVEVGKLTQTITQLQDELKMLKLQSVFNSVVEENGGDKELTWAYLVAQDKLTNVDVTSEDIRPVLQELVDNAFRIKPTLKTQAVTSVKASGTDMSKSSPPLDVKDQIQKLESDGDYKEARALKLARLIELSKE